MKNTLYYGDNLDILRRYIEDESIDLIYLELKRKQRGLQIAKTSRITQQSLDNRKIFKTIHSFKSYDK